MTQFILFPSGFLRPSLCVVWSWLLSGAGCRPVSASPVVGFQVWARPRLAHSFQEAGGGIVPSVASTILPALASVTRKGSR